MRPKPVVILQHEADDPPGSLRFALRALRYPYEMRRLDMGDPMPSWPDDMSALIALGGSMHVTQQDQYPFLAAEQRLMRHMLAEQAPLWGICLGAQVLTLAAGGEVYERATPEVGWVRITADADDELLAGVASPFEVFNWHSYSCALPPGAGLVADGDDGVQLYRAGPRAWAMQFHPEVDAAMVPHWLDDAAAQHPEQGPGFADRLREDTRRLLPSYPAFCAALVRNFLMACGLRDEKGNGGA